MSEPVNEPTPATPSEPPAEPQETKQSSSTQTFPLSFVKRETGRTHTIEGGARTVPITHGETGEPETEYLLVATIDGTEIPLASYNSGRIEVQVKAAKAAQQAKQTEV